MGPVGFMEIIKKLRHASMEMGFLLFSGNSQPDILACENTVKMNGIFKTSHAPTGSNEGTVPENFCKTTKTVPFQFRSQ